jgi:hypothetical protein
MRGRNDLGDLGLDDINSKTALDEVGWEEVGWFDLAQDRDKWRALVNTVMNLRVQQKTRNV